MFCPNCRTEYREGITVCADCGTPLVDALEPDDATYVELVTVYTTSNQSDLLIAKSMLEEAGIEYFAKNDSLVDLFGRVGYNPAIGPIEIQVRPEDADAAQEILLAMDSVPEDDIPHNAEFED